LEQPNVPARTFVVEGYWPAGRSESFGDATRRLDESLGAAAGERVVTRIVAATLVRGDEAAYWVVDAPTAEVVALACAAAELQVERIVGALELRAGKAVEQGRGHGRDLEPEAPPPGSSTAHGGRPHGLED
jgi:hypothetical protein